MEKDFIMKTISPLYLIAFIVINPTSLTCSEQAIQYWHSCIHEMLQKLPRHLRTIPTAIVTMPSWMPFESFNFLRTIFVNKDVQYLSLEQQQATLGHELSHVVLGHSIRQLSILLSGGFLAYQAIKKMFNGTKINPYLKKLLIGAQLYTLYVLFNKYIVYQDELQAEAYNAIRFNNGAAVVNRLLNNMLVEDSKKASSLSEILFNIVAPYFPSSEEQLRHIVQEFQI